MTDVVVIWTEDGKTQEKKNKVRGSLVPGILCSVGGQANHLALCVPADNYLVSTKSSIHCAGSLNWLTRNELMTNYGDKKPTLKLFSEI